MACDKLGCEADLATSPDEVEKADAIILPGVSIGDDAIVGAVAHKSYLNFKANTFDCLLNENGIVIDLKNMWAAEQETLSKKHTYWSL